LENLVYYLNRLSKIVFREGLAMDRAKLLDNHKDYFGSPVPPADPANLKKVWEEYKRIEAGGSRQEEYLHQFPEPDLRHIFFRISILQMVQMMPKGQEMLAPWTHDGKLDDAVFKAFAIVPMKRPQPGENALTSLVDLDESIRLIKAAAI
jgi:hypothetical protein